jgi:hypothetical protein
VLDTLFPRDNEYEIMHICIRVTIKIEGLIKHNSRHPPPRIVQRFRHDMLFLISNLKNLQGVTTGRLDQKMLTTAVRAMPQSLSGPATSLCQLPALAKLREELSRLNDILVVDSTFIENRGWERFESAFRSKTLQQAVETTVELAWRVSEAMADMGPMNNTTVAEIEEWKRNVADERQRREEALDVSMISWIQGPSKGEDMRRKQHEVFRSRHDGTGNWILQDNRYLGWQSGDHTDNNGNPTSRLLWLYGNREKSLFSTQ